MTSDKTEALGVVTDILTDLLTDVFSHVEKCAIIHKVPSGLAAKKKKIGLLDVIRDSSHDVVLTGFSHRQAQFEVIQFTVAKQHKSGYCGHYALHNALLARKMCHANGTEEVQEIIQIMVSSSAYWWRYWCSLKQLLRRVAYDTWWPWTEDHIVTGDMERSFLHYLLDNYHRPSSKIDPPIFVVQVWHDEIRLGIYVYKLLNSDNSCYMLNLMFHLRFTTFTTITVCVTDQEISIRIHNWLI